MTRLSIEIKGLAEIQRAYKKAPDRTRRWALQNMEASLGALESEVVRRTPVGATGHARQGWTTEITGQRIALEGRVFNRDNPVKIASLETGRKPGKMPPWSPGSALYMWVVKKTGSAGARSRSFLIARAIGRRGTKGAFMVKKTKESMGPVVRRLWARRLDELTRQLFR